MNNSSPIKAKANNYVTPECELSIRLDAPDCQPEKPLTIQSENIALADGSTRNEISQKVSKENPTISEPTINEEGAMFAQTGDLMLDAFDTKDKYDKKFVKQCLDNIPFVLRYRVKKQYNQLMQVGNSGRFNANSYLRELAEYCQQFHGVKSMTDDKIETYAQGRAKECYYTATNMLHENDSVQEVLEVLEAILRQNGITPRKGKYIEGDIARYTAFEFWNKKLCKVKAKAVEQVSRHMGIVHRHNQIYITDYNLRARREKKRRTNDFLASMEMINECGDTISLKEASDSNVSNPVNKRNELMCRLSGMEAYADKNGYVADFVTITTPSRMHAVLRTSKPNPKYDNTSPSEAHKFLSGQ